MVEGAPIEHVEHLRSEILMCGGNAEDKNAIDLQIIMWNETISNQKASWQGRKHNKHSHGAAQKDLDIISARGWDLVFFFTQI